MKKNYSFIILSFILSISTNAQTICGIVAENQSLTLTAPVGQVITSINFASYGTPTGSCATNDLTISACHSNTSKSVSYTHLDVYKRQILCITVAFTLQLQVFY